MPSGKSTQPTITDNLDGTVTVQYSPTEAGLHEMHIKYNGAHIPGQPACAETLYRFSASDVNRGKGAEATMFGT